MTVCIVPRIYTDKRVFGFAIAVVVLKLQLVGGATSPCITVGIFVSSYTIVRKLGGERVMKSFEQIKALDQQYIAGTYARYDLDLAKGAGAEISSSEGRELIDFSSGIGVNSLGFGNPRWIAAVKGQLDLLSHSSNLYYTQPQIALAQKLCERMGMSKVFFCNSGAEANEGAIKVARKYSADKYAPQRCEIVTLVNSFHGRTIATLAATGQDVFHKNFGPFPPGFSHAVANDLEDLKRKINPQTCAIMVELIQGEGGVIPLEPDFVEGIRQLCEEQDLLLLVDEVQTGVGRTGAFLCCEHYGLKADVVTLAKGLGGGLPIGAFLLGEKTAGVLGFGDHGTTFGGNPVIAAGAVAVLDTMTPQFLKEVADKGDYLGKQLVKLPHVTGITGKGLMIGIALEEGLTSSQLVKDCIAQGLIMLTAKEKLRLLPPLTISMEELEKGLGILGKVLAAATAN